MSKKMFRYHDIPVPPFIVVDREQAGAYRRNNIQLVAAMVDFPLPWVVKPVAEGSSIGVSIVKSESELEDAMKKAFSYGKKIIIEKYIPGKEIQIGILGQRILGGVEVKPAGEFYSYEDKYRSKKTKYILPPDVNEPVYGIMKEIALKAHNALGCTGATRVDLILDESNNPYVLEVNTIAGMTETSLLPKIARYSGMEIPQLVEEILILAVTDEKRTESD